MTSLKVNPFTLTALGLFVLFLGLGGPTAAAAKFNSGLDRTATVAGIYTEEDSRSFASFTISYFISEVLNYVGVAFLIVCIIAGFMWMTAQGNEEKISKAKKLLAGAAVGAVLVLGAYAITKFLITTTQQSVGVPTPAATPELPEADTSDFGNIEDMPAGEE